MYNKYNDKYCNAIEKVKTLKKLKESLPNEIKFWENEVKEFERLIKLESKV